MRDNKGNRWEKHFNDYTVIDLETCGVIGDDRNYVIELSAIKVREGIVVDEFTSLVNPMRAIPPLVKRITGIDNSMVASAPTIQDIMNKYLDFIGVDIVVGYNINTFDYNILYDLAESLYSRIFSNDFVDILYAVKRTIKEIDDQIKNVGETLNLDAEQLKSFQKLMWSNKQEFDDQEMQSFLSESDAKVVQLENRAKHLRLLSKIRNNPYFGSIIFKTFS